MSDNKLELEIDASAAKAELDSVIEKFRETADSADQSVSKTSQSLDKLGTQGQTAVQRLSGAMQNSMTTLQSAMQSLSTFSAGVLEGFMKPFDALGGALDRTLPALKNVGGAFLSLGKSAGSIAWSAITGGLSLIGSMAANAARMLMTMLTRFAGLAVVAAIFTPIVQAFMQTRTEAIDMNEAIRNTGDILKQTEPEVVRTADALAKLGERYGLTEDAIKKLKRAQLEGGSQDITAAWGKEADELEKLRDKTIESRDANIQRLQGVNALITAGQGNKAALLAEAKALQDGITAQTTMIGKINQDIAGKKALIETTDQAAAASRGLGSSAAEIGRNLDTGKTSVDGFVQGLQGVQGAKTWMDTLKDAVGGVLGTLGQSAAQLVGYKTNTDAAKTATTGMSESIKEALRSSDLMNEKLKTVSEETRRYVEAKLQERQVARDSIAASQQNITALGQESAALGAQLTPLNDRLKALQAERDLESSSANSNADRLAYLNQQIGLLNNEREAIFTRMNAIDQQIAADQRNIESQKLVITQTESSIAASLKANKVIGDFEGTYSKLTGAMDGAATALDKSKTAMETLGTNTGTTKTGTEQLQTATENMAGAQTRSISDVDNLTAALKRQEDQYRRTKAAADDLNGGGGGGGSNIPSQRQGGYVGDRLETQRVNMDAFNNAPQFAEGGTTNGLVSKISGGGIPIIAHPREAIVPLSKGRSIPVDISGQLIDTGAADLAKAIKPLSDATQAMAQSAMGLAQLDPRPRLLWEVGGPGGKALHPRTEPNRIDLKKGLKSNYDQTGELIPGAQGPGALGAHAEQYERKESNKRNVTVNVTYSDLDGFGMTRQQKMAELAKEIERTVRQNG